MSSAPELSRLWSSGRYEAVGERIASLAQTVVEAVDARRRLRDASVVDLACGTGSAALFAAGLGATVTAVDITGDLIEIGKRKAEALRHTVTWVTSDAADTGLPEATFDAAVSNMGIIFVDPARQVAEISRLLKPSGLLGFSAWSRPGEWSNPFFEPVIEVLGPPPERDYTPDQWGDRTLIEARLGAEFDEIEIVDDVFTWSFATVDDALTFVTSESPMHVDVFARAGNSHRADLTAAFEAAFGERATEGGMVSFGAPYVVVTAVRR